MVIDQKGFTLVELMVVVAIIGVIALAATSYTSAWVDDVRVGEGKALIARAHSQAKAVALRNPRGARDDDVAAGFKVAGGNMLVCAGDPDHAQCAAGGSRVVWQSAWPVNVATSVDEVAINGRGQVLVNGSSVNAGLSYTISKGNVVDESPYNVFR